MTQSGWRGMNQWWLDRSIRVKEVLRRLRAEPATADIPVAVLSAEATPGVIRRMQASGVVAYLTKPLDLADLGHLIRSFRTGPRTGAIPGTPSR